MKLVKAYPSYYTGVLKFVNTYIFLPLALTCTFFLAAGKLFIHGNHAGQSVGSGWSLA